jgi:hypothetical protein
MKKKYIILLLVLSCILLGSCDFTRSKRLGKTNYYLVDGNPPGTSYWGLYYQYPDMSEWFVGVFEGQVTDIFWNDEYIFATLYDFKNDSIEGYYIIKMLPPVEKGVPWEKIGILSKEEYEQKKQELLLNEKEMNHINVFD